MGSDSALFPKRSKDPSEQVEIHHEVLVRHARKFTDHADWMTALHTRITSIEQKDPSQQIAALNVQFAIAMAKLRAIVWTFGVVWTVVMTTAGIVASLVLR